MNTIRLRDLTERDLPILFEHQLDPAALQRAAFPARSRDTFMKHWKSNVLGNPTTQKMAILVGDCVAGYVVSWDQGGKKLLGYWLGREYWDQGIATQAVAGFVASLKARPLHAFVASHNRASIRVLEKCGFQECGRENDEVLMVLNPVSE